MNKSTHFLKYILFVVAGIGIFSYVVMFLWNWILVSSAGWNPITFWQAMGLLLLSRILFGHWGRGESKWKKHQWKHKMKEKWDSMSQEEKDKFKDMMSPCAWNQSDLRSQ